jgi:hypothetical protein
MRNTINKILKEEVYNIFEDEEFDPLGHIGDEETDDLGELGVDLTKDCVLGFSNGNSKLEWPYLSLPAGYTCPFATMCKNFPAKWEGPVKGGRFKKPASWEKNVKPGPKAKFMCYAARAQGQYPGANIQAFKNLDLIKKFKTKEEIADLIIKSMRFHKIQDTDIFRIHEAGDFFSQIYFDAWIEVAKKLPGTLFYAYTVSLPFWIARKGQIPKNFKLIASMDEENAQTILDNDLRYSKVVSSVEEAKELGLLIDVDDSIAWGSDENFALLIHGPQPSGSEAAQALKRNKEAGMYGKEGVMSKAKSRNQVKKDALRDKIKRQLRGEQHIREDFEMDWIKDIKPNISCEQLRKLKKGDLIKVKGEMKPKTGTGRGFTFNDNLGVVKGGKSYKGDPTTKIAYHDTYDTENSETGYVEVAFKDWSDGYSNLLDKESILTRIVNYIRNIDSVKCDKYNCAKIWCHNLDTVEVLPMNRLIKDKYTSYMSDDLEEDMVYWGTEKIGRDEYEMGPVTEANEWGGTGRDLEMRGHRDYDKNVYVHRNLNAPPYFSIKKAGGATGGKVIGYDTSIHLRDVRFIVGERGNREVLPVEFGGEGKAKNVHAGAVGKHVSSGQEYDTSGWRLVRYNPRAGHQTFIYADTEEPIHNASEVILKNGKEVWVR